MRDSQVEEIKSRLDIADVVRGYMKIEKSGINFRGSCPFHKEKTPSFFVSPSRQLWKCFGCLLGGDIFSFLMHIEGVEFKEALKTLADKAGVRLASYDPKTRSEKARLYEICEKSCQFFEKQLPLSSLGNEAREYLKNRGIEEESIKKFRIGFAPNTKKALYDFLRSQGYSPNEIFKAGLIITASDNSNYDRFRSRVMFPICDLNGQIIGFGGRIFFSKNQAEDKKLAKYVNTPQTLLYDKSKTLYGLDKAKMKIRENGSCVVVEGYTDVVLCHQSGFENVVASSGTALTESQLDIIRRYTENLITAFDMDIAGDGATKRGIDIASTKGFNIKVISLPEGKDPAEIIQKDEKIWKKAADAPISIGDFYFKTALARFDKKTPEGIRGLSGALLPMIKRIPSGMEQSYWVQKLSQEIDCSEDVIWRDLEKIETKDEYENRENVADANQTASKFVKKEKKDLLAERALLAIIQDASPLDSLSKKDLGFFKETGYIFSIIKNIKNSHSIQGGSFVNPSDIKEFSQEERRYLEELIFQEEVFPSFAADSDIKQEFFECLNALKKLCFKEKLFALHKEMKRGADDEDILRDFQKISIELAKL